MPTAVNILRGTWERGWSFIKKAGTVILLASIFVWFTSSFGLGAEQVKHQERIGGKGGKMLCNRAQLTESPLFNQLDRFSRNRIDGAERSEI